MITTAARLNSVNEYYFSQKLREIDSLNKQGKNIINLGIGSPDMPPHPDVIKTLQEESAKPNVHGYQNYKGSPVLRHAFAHWYKAWYKAGIDAETEVLPLIGSKEGIMHICMAYFEEGCAVLVPNPGYPTYASAVKLSGATPLYYDLKEENNYEPDFNQLEELVKQAASFCPKGIKGLWANYPHMPTGQPASAKIFEQLVAFGRKHNMLICHDNPYSFILNDEPLSILSVDGAREVALELNSLSKAQNMAGWRVGVLCGDKERINEVLRFKSNMDSGMFLPVQLAAAKALLLGKDWYESINAVYKKRREKVYELLDALNCVYSKQQAGMFMWAKTTSPLRPAEELSKHPLGAGGILSDKVLYENNVFITPGGIFGNSGNDYIRISLCATEEKLGEAIERITKQELGIRNKPVNK
ncbi:pyridoxal phosphate-dependent aminotransferase [Parafilimonas sp.]|uniref:pyridoxal phosphate-dependent aminotransferase n=1 Tax=Parafilimonas sp. TaxID=1969739 RepID=UPI0039E7097D